MAIYPAAVFTVVQDENVFLPLWVEYYSRFFGPKNIYVLDHDTRDGSIEDARRRGVNVVPVHNSATSDHFWLLRTVECFYKFLLYSYRAVIFSEADEFVVVDKTSQYGDISGLIYNRLFVGRPVSIRCRGLEIIQRPEEREIDWSKPILAQRSSCLESEVYSKTLISNIPLRWELGFHTLKGGAHGDPDPAAYLLHLHRIDKESCRARHEKRASRRWSQQDVEAGRGVHNLIYQEPHFTAWFYSDYNESRTIPIPEGVRVF